MKRGYRGQNTCKKEGERLMNRTNVLRVKGDAEDDDYFNISKLAFTFAEIGIVLSRQLHQY